MAGVDFFPALYMVINELFTIEEVKGKFTKTFEKIIHLW